MTKHQRKAELSILLIDEDVDRAATITSALDKSRYKIRHLLSPSTSLLREVDALKPDVIVIDMESPNRDILESLDTLFNFNPTPIVMFSHHEDEEMINLSAKMGVSAYVVGDTDPKRVKPILDAAIARFHEYQRLKNELDETRQQLEARKVVDQAKRLLMQKNGMDENDAFHSMRKTAMDTGQKLEEVAKTMISFVNTLDDRGNP